MPKIAMPVKRVPYLRRAESHVQMTVVDQKEPEPCSTLALTSTQKSLAGLQYRCRSVHGPIPQNQKLIQTP
jgi:hypothetical protein